MPEKTCSTCQCNKVCDHNKYGFENCGNYISGDVTPRAEVERLQRILDSYALQYGTATDKEVFLKKERADTVRKMHDSIKERCIKGGIYPAFVKSVVEAVAKELSEDVTPAKFLSLEIVSRAIKDYCCDLTDAGKDMVEVTEFNADLQKILEYYIGEKDNGTS